MNDTSTSQGTSLIFRRILDPFPLDDVPRYLMYIAAVLLLGAGISFALSQKSHQGGALRFWAGIVGLCGFMFAIVYMLFLGVIPSETALYLIMTFWAILGIGILVCGMLNRTWFTHLIGSLGFLMVLFIIGELFVAAWAIVYLRFRGQDSLPYAAWPGEAWLGVLVVVGLFAIPYIITQYIRDIIYLKALGIVVGLVLVLGRILVLAILAFFFTLPALQTSEEVKQHSKVIVLIDTSDSITRTRDKVPPVGTPLSAMPTRQDEVLEFLDTQRQDPKTKEMQTFLRGLQNKNPVTVYRFASGADPEFTTVENGLHLWKREITENQVIERTGSTDSKHAGVAWTKADWLNWLVPDEKRLQTEAAELRDRSTSNEDEKKRLEELIRAKRFLLDNTGSTNVPNSVLEVLKQEGGNMVQGIIVFTDGRSTEEAPQAYRELAEMARQRKVPIFAVRVGEDRPKVELEIAEVRRPEQVRPDDTFNVTVQVRAKGMSSEKVIVYVDIYQPGQDPKGKDVKPFRTLEQEITLTAREPIQGKYEIKIDPEEYGELADELPGSGSGSGSKPKDDKPPSDGKKRLRQGTWSFVARVPRDPREIFPDAEHTTKETPAEVKVIERPMSVLLFASAPTHEYQFVRTLLVREKDRRRVELSIYIQPAPGLDQPRNGIVQDVEPERLLDHFPHLYQDSSLDQKSSGSGASSDHVNNLQNYDLIVCFDPDWTNKISADALSNVNKWVNQGGGLIIVGGPINTLQLARPGPTRDSLKPINDILPVELADSRIQDLERPTLYPWPLVFQTKNITPEMEFLNLDETKDETGQGNLVSGWDGFFWGTKAEVKKDVLRGIYNFYPVLKVKKGANLIATFNDPSVQRLKDGTEMPYMAYHPVVGRGKSFWIGSGELWRLRGYKMEYHERFWTKLCRFIGSSNMTKQNSRIVPYISRRFPAKSIAHLEAQIYDKTLKPLLPNAKPPELEIIPPLGVDDEKKDDKPKKFPLKPKPVTDEPRGWFEVDFPVGQAANGYKYKLTVPDSGDAPTDGVFDVYPSNPELDNTAPDLKALYYDLASPARDVLAGADPAAKLEFEQRRRLPAVPKGDKKDDDKGEDRKSAGGDRLYFDLNNADMIPRLLTSAEKSQTNKGESKDLIYDERLEMRLENWSMIITGFLGVWLAVIFMMQLLRESTEHSMLWYLWRTLALVPVALIGFGLWWTMDSWGSILSHGEMLWAIVAVTLTAGWLVLLGLQLLLNDCKNITPLWFLWRGLVLTGSVVIGFGLWELGMYVQNLELFGWLPGGEPESIVTWFAIIATVLVWWSLLMLVQMFLRDSNEVSPLFFLWRGLGHFGVLAIGFIFWALGTVITAQGIATLLNVPMTAALIVGAIIPTALLVWFGLQMLRDWRDHLSLEWFLQRGAVLVGVLLVGAGIFMLGIWWEASGRLLSSAALLLAGIVPVLLILAFAVQLYRDRQRLSLGWFLWRGGALVMVSFILGSMLVMAAVVEKSFPGAADAFNNLYTWPVNMKPEDALIPVVMMVVVSLLCFEWLSRKLLRLA